MSDIVERLRGVAHTYDEHGMHSEIELEAAAEIERLRAAVQDLAKHIWRGDWDKLKPETRAALGEKQ
jgi:hypothetical protein